MNTPICTVPGCNQPCPDQAFVCSRCGHHLAVDLGRVADLAEALEDALAKRVRIDRPPSPHPDDADDGGELSLHVQPLPVDLDAGDRIRELREVLCRWAYGIALERGLFVPVSTWPALGAWLLDQVEWLRHRDQGPAAVTEIGDVVGQVMRFVDRPKPRWGAGMCAAPMLDENGLLRECDEVLYPESGAVKVKCPACGVERDIEERRKLLLAGAEDRLATAATIARAVTVLEDRVTSAQIRGWAFRKRLLVKGHDDQGRPLYRIGDVLDLVRDDLSAADRRSTKREKIRA